MRTTTLPRLAALALLPAACVPETRTGASGVWMPTADASGDDEADVDDGGGSEAGDASDGGPGESGAHGDDGGSEAGDDGPDGGHTVPELGTTMTVVATAADGLDVPRDLQFAPDHPSQLWVANAGFHGVVIVTDPGTSTQAAEARADYFAQHFMMNVSSIAFGTGNTFASCQESRDEWNGAPQAPDDFMGPTLWDADLDVFAVVHQGDGSGEGSHLDMLHQSPLCMGIAWESGSAYWAFDGFNEHLVRYDFKSDHGPGGGDHSDGSIRRYLNAVVTRRADVPGHMVFDPDSRLLYVADTGSGRVMALDVDSGASNGELYGNWDGVGEYSGWDGASWEPVVSGLAAPAGLALHGGRLFVGEYDTGQIVAFTTAGAELGRVATGAAGIMGVDIGPDGRLWFVDGVADELVRVDP